METKYFSLPVKIIENKNFSLDDSLIPVDIKVMHNGLNLNNTYFSDEVIEEAKDTLKNKPILGYIKKQDGSDEKDFGEHEIEIVLSEDSVKVVVLERPLGVIPETNNYAIQEEDGRKYVICRGYLWKEYLNEAYDILKEKPNKSVSMEIAVDDYDINDDGSINIKKYRYLGVTILGDDLTPAMKGAELNVIGQFSHNDNKDFYNKIEELNKKLLKYFSQNKDDNNQGGENMPTDNKQNKRETFSTYNQKREALRNALDPVIIKNDDDEIIKETYYYVMDFDDDYVYVERHIWEENNYEVDNGRFTYEFNEETLKATITGEFEKMILVWLTEEENQKIQEERKQYSIVSEELKDLKEKYNNLSTEHEEVVDENKELKEFKENVIKQQKQAEIDEVFNKYSNVLDTSDMEDLRGKAMDMDIVELEKELSFRLVQKKFNFSKTSKKDSTKIKIVDDNDDNEPYGSASVYFNK